MQEGGNSNENIRGNFFGGSTTHRLEKLNDPEILKDYIPGSEFLIRDGGYRIIGGGEAAWPASPRAQHRCA